MNETASAVISALASVSERILGNGSLEQGPGPLKVSLFLVVDIIYYRYYFYQILSNIYICNLPGNFATTNVSGFAAAATAGAGLAAGLGAAVARGRRRTNESRGYVGIRAANEPSRSLKFYYH